VAPLESIQANQVRGVRDGDAAHFSTDSVP